MTDGEYDCYLFDLDGTLVDVEESYVRDVVERVGDRIGCSFAENEVLSLWYGTDEVRHRTLDRHGVGVRDFWDTFETVRDPAARVDATYLYDDAAVVGDLDRPAGLVTHCPEPITNDVIDAVGIRDWFDTVVCCDDDVGWKPDPDPVHRTLEGIGVAPDALSNGTSGVLVGDAPSDVGAAWNTGLRAAHVERHDPAVRGRCVLGDERVSGVDELFA